MADYILSERSKKDLVEIGDYTKRTWSEEQSIRYLRLLFSQFRLLATRPSLGRSYDQIHPGLWGCHCGKHIIFYRILADDRVRIIRVLHEKMDYPQHL